MDIVLDNLTTIFSGDQIVLFMRAAIIALFGWSIAKLVSNMLVRIFRKHTDAQGVMLIRTFSFYLIISVVVVMTIKQLGFDIGVLLGAAGILTVAVGFASQTSMSNLISGLFLLGERPFSVGDTVRVGQVIGEVLSIDLLSVKLRTFDNLFVRVPNEVLIKKEVTNYSRFSIRRLDIPLRVTFDQDLVGFEKILRGVAERNNLCLVEPAPFFLVRSLSEFYIEVVFGVWTLQTNYLKLKNAIYQELLTEMRAQNITIPYPQQVMHYQSDPPIGL